MDPGGGRTRAFVCIANRCALNTSGGGTVVPDSGVMPPMVDTGVTPTPDTGMMGTPDSGIHPDATSGITPSMCTPPMLPAGANGTAADNMPPNLFSPSIMPAAPNANDMIMVSVSAAEGGCGIESASMTIESEPAGNDPVQRIQATSQSGAITITAGTPSTITMNATVLDCLQPVPHRVTQMHVRDFAGNTTTFRFDAMDSACNPQIPGNPNAECYKQTTNLNTTPASTSLQVMQMTPSTTGSLPPTLNAATLAGAGTTLSGNIGVNPDNTCPMVSMDLTITNGSRTKIETVQFNTGAYSISVPQCAATGNWELTGIRLKDMQGRESNYLKLGAAPTFQLNGTAGSGVNVPAAVALTGGNDTASPVLTQVVTVPSNDPQVGTSVMTDFHATDPGCGFGLGSVIFTNGTGNSFSAALAAGGPGVFGCGLIPQCAPRGNYTVTGSVLDTYGASTTFFDNTMGAYGLFQSDGTMTSSVPAALITISHN